MTPGSAPYAVILLLCGSACGGKHAPASEGVARTLATPRQQSSISEAIATPPFVAVVAAKHTANVTSQTEGTLLTMDVRLGDSVEVGDRLASIDDRPLREQLAAAQASSEMRHAEANMAALSAEHAKLEFEREERLASDGLVTGRSRAAADNASAQAKAKVKQTKAALREAQAVLAKATRSLKQTVVTAPVAGIVATRFVDPGNEVTRGQPLVRLVAKDTPWVRFGVPAGARDALKVGDALTFTSVDGKRQASVQVSHIAPDVDPLSELVIAEANFARERAQGLYPGLAGYVTLRGQPPPTQTRSEVHP